MFVEVVERANRNVVPLPRQNGFHSTTEEVFETARVGEAVRVSIVLEKMNAGERIAAFETKSTSVSLMGGQTETTPLITAVEKGNPDCMKILLSYKADMKVKGNFSVMFFSLRTSIHHYLKSPKFGRQFVGRAGVGWV